MCVRTEINAPVPSAIPAAYDARMGRSHSADGDPAIAAWAALLRCHAAAVPVISDELTKATGLPLSWYDVLLELRSAERGRLRMRELGGRVVLSRSRVSRIVDEMVDAGLVQRDVDPRDRRSSFATLTALGEGELRKAAPVYLGAVGRHFAAHLSEREQLVVARALSRVAHAAAMPSGD